MNSSKIKKEETARTSQMRAARRNSTLPRRAGRPSLSSRLSHVASAVAGAGVAAAAVRWSAVPPEHPSSGASVGSWASESLLAATLPAVLVVKLLELPWTPRALEFASVPPTRRRQYSRELCRPPQSYSATNLVAPPQFAASHSASLSNPPAPSLYPSGLPAP